MSTTLRIILKIRKITFEGHGRGRVLSVNGLVYLTVSTSGFEMERGCGGGSAELMMRFKWDRENKFFFLMKKKNK